MRYYVYEVLIYVLSIAAMASGVSFIMAVISGRAWWAMLSALASLLIAFAILEADQRASFS